MLRVRALKTQEKRHRRDFRETAGVERSGIGRLDEVFHQPRHATDARLAVPLPGPDQMARIAEPGLGDSVRIGGRRDRIVLAGQQQHRPVADDRLFEVCVDDARGPGLTDRAQTIDDGRAEIEQRRVRVVVFGKPRGVFGADDRIVHREADRILDGFDLQFGLRGDLQSDSASVLPIAQALVAVPGLRFMRDPTRGGLATVAHDICRATGHGVRLDAAAIPVRDPVASVCEMLGYDPYYLACEGRVVAVVAPDRAAQALAAMHTAGATEAAVIGEITRGRAHVVLATELGGERLLEELEDDPLPRIC